MSRKQITKNIFSLYVLQGVNYLLPLVVLPYLVRVLGPERFGLLSFAQAFMLYFVMLTDYGFNLTATKKIARNKDQPHIVSKVCSNVLTIKLSMLLLGFVLLLGIVFGFSKFSQDWKLYLVSYLMVVGNALFPLWYFHGLEQMRLITIANVIGKAITAIGIFTLVRHQDEIVLAALLQSLSFVLIGVIGLGAMLYFGKMRINIPSYREIREEIVEGWDIFLSTAAVSFYTASNAFFLGIFSTNTAVGYFSAADKIVKAINGLTTPIFQSLYPHLNALFVKSQHQAKLFLQKVTRGIGLGTLLLSFCAFVFAPLAVRLIFGNNFEPTINVLRWMSPLPFLVGINTVFGMLTMITFGMNRLLTRIVIVAGFFNFILVIFLIRYYDAVGAAIAVTLTEVLTMTMMLKTLNSKKTLFHFKNGLPAVGD
jgi:polysaccharide transporter, PST family